MEEKNENKIESLAIILDGNGRYAKKYNLPRALGHKKGCENLEVILEECVAIGIKYLIVYAFSTENWKRDKEEIDSLMDLFLLYIPKISKKAKENDVKVNFIGDISKFRKDIYDLCIELMNETKNNKRSTFVVAFNYGGRDEIVRGIKRLYNDKNREFDINDLTEEKFSKYLDTKEFKDPDLLIRTSGELRLSNFLLWQIAYSEIYVTNTLWPEFSVSELHKAIDEYSNRERRFGGRKNEKTEI